MAENVLEKIIKKKSERLIDLKKKRPIESLLEHSPDSHWLLSRRFCAFATQLHPASLVQLF